MKYQIAGLIAGLFVRPFNRSRPPSKTVAIVVPLTSRPGLTEDEKISMRQLLHHLGDYDKFLLMPEGVDWHYEGFRAMKYPAKYFGSAAAHGKLLGSRSLYRDFSDYEYIFFHHLDALAFSDQLEDWCRKGYDYIGPPWIKCDDSPWVDRPRVGNGGFTLLRVESALKALTNRYLAKPTAWWFDLFTFHSPPWLIRILEKLEERFPKSKTLRSLMREWREMEDPAPHNRNNDIFWSDMAVLYYPEFKVAPLEEGLSFAFEVSPRTCFEMNGGRMPFGCHAWARYDREFWTPHLVPAGLEQDKEAVSA
jgi:hypothetical protein